MKTLVTCLLALVCITASASDGDRIQSLRKSISKTKNDQKKIKLYIELGELYSTAKSDSVYPIAVKLLLLSENTKDNCGRATAHFFMGNYFYKTSDVSEALKQYRKVLDIRKKYCSKESVASVQMQLGNVHSLAGNHKSAVTNYHSSLAYYEKQKNYEEVSKIHLNLGSSEESRKNYKKAESHYRISLNMFDKTKDTLTLGNAYNNLGGLYQERKKIKEALVYFEKAMDIYASINYNTGLAHGLNNIGIIYYYSGDEDSCMIYFKKSLGIRKKAGDKRNISQSYNNIGSLYMYQEKFNYAVMYCDSALRIAKEAGVKEEMSEAHFTLHEVYFNKGEFKKSIEHLKIYSDFQSELFSEQNERIIREKDTKYESVKREQELKEKNRSLQRKESAIQKQNIIIWSSSLGGALLVLLLIVLINRNKISKRQNKIIEEQKSIVDKKQLEIINSIKYAKRIQQALLKSEYREDEQLPEHFVMFKPKDIVSGDFYWVQQRDNFIYLAVADCTGHGVPGAFLTMLGSSFLNEIYTQNDILLPSEILDKLRIKFVKELSQSEIYGESKDGMDISLVRIDLGSNELMWSGANNALWIMRKDADEIEVIKPDKEPIAHSRVMTPFENHKLQLNPGDTFYLFSDGYADQFGGPKGKKFKSKTFRNLIAENQSKSMQEQKEFLDITFNNWKGELEQVDDVCIVGMRL